MRNSHPTRTGVATAAPAAVPAGGRELATDRPDATETPYTVKPGKVQVEASMAACGRDRPGGELTEEWDPAPAHVGIGLTRNAEPGVFVPPQLRRTESVRGGPATTVRGEGDTVRRGKINFRGNDGEGPGFGSMVKVKLPTAAAGLGNHRTERAQTLPVTFEAGAGRDGAAMTAVEWARTDPGRRKAVWMNTVSFARNPGAGWGTFPEAVPVTGDGRHRLLANVAATRRLTPELQSDAGGSVGVSRTAPDLGVFAGFARRFRARRGTL